MFQEGRFRTNWKGKTLEAREDLRKQKQLKTEGRAATWESGHPGGASEDLPFDRADCDPIWSRIFLILPK